MSYKTILLYLHDIRRAGRLLEAALPIARQMGAHLIALNVMPPYVVLPGGEVGGGVTVDAHRESYRPEIAQLKARFLEATRLEQASVEWREVDANFSSAVAVVVEHGRVCDLIIANQKDPEWTLSEFLEEPERLPMESGRPVVLVPNHGKIVVPPKRATIAWNGRREAVRAAFDALPLLAGVDEVNLLSIRSHRERGLEGDFPGADFAPVLDRHGIKCVLSQSSATDDGVGAEILRQADAFGSDLLVMGVYGHSRLREFVLGGASRDVLAKLNRPVLMSH